jgi:hypothetical protein
MEYFIAIGDDRQGPFTEETIREKAKVGDVGPDNLAWNDTMDDWEPLPRVFPGMEFAPKKQAPPLPAGAGSPKDTGPLYAIAERFWDGVMDKLDFLFSPKLFDRLANIFVKAGYWALPIGTVLSVLFGIIAAVKTDSISLLLSFGFGYAVLLSILNYSVLKTIPALDKLIDDTETRLGSPAFPHCLSLVALIGGFGMFVGGLFGAIKGESFIPVIIGAVFLFFGIQWVTFCRHPEMLNVKTGETVTPGEELLGLISFLFKSWLKVLPIYFGLFISLVVLAQIFGLITMMGGEGNGTALFVVCTYSLAGVASIPLLTYIMFLCTYFIIDLLSAILALLRIQKSVEKN